MTAVQIFITEMMTVMILHWYWSLHVVEYVLLSILQAVRVLTELLKAVHVTEVASPESTSDFSLVTTPRPPLTAEPTPMQDNSM